MNTELKFKTNLDCQHCVARVKPLLDKVSGIESWSVDLANPDKVLTVQSSGANAEQVIDTVEQAGFDISKI
ncbi:heavy-metal-associated domain-containing protein [Dysgonomonas macrotermitis]|uniref:Copper chaperone n=1 Tax=Dysgonomonas macrotermitis TaxID=1346286 RepID=A0A1M4Y7C1_9BACT|nr:heavy-metal-associated domain-containing protein [Dysgonomonas macrotermitis]SHF01605.1 copper chaperone [Dysgonomonas macrotermitis]